MIHAYDESYVHDAMCILGELLNMHKIHVILHYLIFMPCFLFHMSANSLKRAILNM